MPQCQAINCTTRSGSKKSYFSMPDPSKSAEDKCLCKLWIDKLKNAKLDIKTFKASRTMVVCEDHFTDDCFVGVYANTVAESLSFRHSRKVLKKGSVPTIVHTQPQQITKGERQSSLRHQRKREKALIKKNLIALRESHSSSPMAEEEVVQQRSLESPACIDKCIINGEEDNEIVEQPPFGHTTVEYPPFEQTTVEYPPFTATPLVIEESQYNGQPMYVEEVVVQTTVSDRAVPVTRATPITPVISQCPSYAPIMFSSTTGLLLHDNENFGHYWKPQPGSELASF